MNFGNAAPMLRALPLPKIREVSSTIGFWEAYYDGYEKALQTVRAGSSQVLHSTMVLYVSYIWQLWIWFGLCNYLSTSVTSVASWTALKLSSRGCVCGCVCMCSIGSH